MLLLLVLSVWAHDVSRGKVQVGKLGLWREAAVHPVGGAVIDSDGAVELQEAAVLIAQAEEAEEVDARTVAKRSLLQAVKEFKEAMAQSRTSQVFADAPTGDAHGASEAPQDEADQDDMALALIEEEAAAAGIILDERCEAKNRFGDSAACCAFVTTEAKTMTFEGSLMNDRCMKNSHHTCECEGNEYTTCNRCAPIADVWNHQIEGSSATCSVFQWEECGKYSKSSPDLGCDKHGDGKKCTWKFIPSKSPVGAKLQRCHPMDEGRACPGALGRR